MLHYYRKAEKEQTDVREYLTPLINDEERLAGLVQQVQEKIKQLKHK